MMFNIFEEDGRCSARQATQKVSIGERAPAYYYYIIKCLRFQVLFGCL